MKVDLTKLQPLIDEKYISVRKHPEEDLWIYDYTQNCQFEKKWTPETMMCRGLILDAEGNVIARPFNKFFNQGENGDTPHSGNFTAYDKMDGSMGIMYPHAGGTKLSIATRGSFVSDQAIEGTKMLQKYLDSRDIKKFLLNESKTKTYIFEILYPENRIVCDYHGKRELVLLATRDIETGIVTPAETEHNYSDLFECTQKINDFRTPRDNAEGVVLYYDDGFMEKCKYAEYVRKHAIATGTTSLSVWRALKENISLEDIKQNMPDEFIRWLDKTIGGLKKQYDEIEWYCSKITNMVTKLETRKEQAEQVKGTDYPGIVFNMLDNDPYSDLIWKIIRPKFEKPYTIEV